MDTTRTFTLPSGPFTVAVRARDAAGNWSAWREAKVLVDADAPVMTTLVPSLYVPRAANGKFTVSWGATDNTAVTGYCLADPQERRWRLVDRDQHDRAIADLRPRCRFLVRRRARPGCSRQLVRGADGSGDGAGR